MKKLFLVTLFFTTCLLSAQGVFFKMGKNFTSFSYKNTTPFTEKIKINGTGSSYELGYAMPLKYKDFSYLGSVTLNDYNATGESDLNNLEWKTTYIGVQNVVDYRFYDSFYFFISAQAGLNVSTMLYGKQQLNNATYNLTKNKDFSGLILQPVLGLNAKYYISKSGYLSLGCNFTKSMSLNPTSEKVSFNTFQILFGGYFDLIKDKHL
ncbi:MAG: hypothetical protein RLY43_2308 [Bacteroidota bacterium]|jgi:hypothetical protein